jgi:ubiquinone/menaquinone biosynthesis C-methylase UbiE
MPESNLSLLLLRNQTVERNSIHLCKNLTDQTVWDTLANENPTHAVISAKDEADAALKSRDQIEDMKRNLKEGDILLDLGCGYGRVAQYLLPQIELGGYIGVDSSHTMLSLFLQRHKMNSLEQRTPLLLVNADIHTIPLADKSVDIVIVCAVFLHNHKDVVRKSIAELERIIKPNGKLLVYSSFPYGTSLLGVQGHLYQAFLNLMGKPFKNGPVRYYSKREVSKLLKGFAEVELIPTGFAVLPKTIIFLPRPVEKLYRLGIANPVNRFLEKITPISLKPYFATHYDVVAVR